VSDVVTLVISIALMLAVVGACMTWAVREQRRRNETEEGHARHH
jgi:putative effector of murein hydrolase LrgA (UPF0299 family)